MNIWGKRCHNLSHGWQLSATEVWSRRRCARLVLLGVLLMCLVGVPVAYTLAEGSIFGEIGDMAVDTLEFDTALGVKPVIIHVAGNVYAIAYAGSGSDGYLKTVTMGHDGQIGDAVIDTLEFDTARGIKPDIVHVSGSIYAIAYTGPSNDGFLKTVQIADNGQIGDTVIDALRFDMVTGFEPDIVHISGNIYGIAYRGSGLDGTLKTVQIADNGQIGDIVIDTLKFDTAIGAKPAIIQIAGNIYGIAYIGPQYDGFLKTVQIASNGQIADNVLDTLEFDAVRCDSPNIIQVLGDIYAIVYTGSSNDGLLKTVQIASNGQIGDMVIDTLRFDTVTGLEPDIIHVSGNVYAIAYRGSGQDGTLKTVQVSSDGQITDMVIDTMRFDNGKGFEPRIVHIAGNVYAVVYRGHQNDGFLKTVSIVTYFWESYRDAAHTVVWGTVTYPYDGDYQIAYMFGDGFIASHRYAVGFYDGEGIKAQSDNVFSGADNKLRSDYLLSNDANATPGTWQAVVFDGDAGSPPPTYADCASADGYVIEDSFEVTPAAIPEFPGVLSAIGVTGVCSGIYYYMRKRRLRYVSGKA